MTLRVTGAVLTVVFLATSAAADLLPLAYQVTGVDASDMLNIRSAPSTHADIIGSINPFATAIEVIALSTDGKWGKIGVPEGNGWVAMRFLEKAPSDDVNQVPRPMTCMGTEPFWAISLYPRGAEYNSPETGVIPLSVKSERSAPQGYLLTLEEGPTLDRTMIITRETCHDGMSDREYGFTSKIFVDAPDGNQILSGCCTLDHR